MVLDKKAYYRLFRFYIRNLVDRITKLNIGCHYFGTNITLLAYADDIVLLAPSWCGMQSLLSVTESSANEINMSFYTNKTVLWFLTPLISESLFVILSQPSDWRDVIFYLLNILNRLVTL